MPAIQHPIALLAILGTLAGLAITLFGIAGKLGKPGIRARAIPAGTRTRSREEVLFELDLGRRALDRARAEAKAAALRLSRMNADLDAAEAALEAAEGVGHA